MKIDGIILNERVKETLLNFQYNNNDFLKEQIRFLHETIKLMAKYSECYNQEDQIKTLDLISLLYSLEDNLTNLFAEEGGES